MFRITSAARLRDRAAGRARRQTLEQELAGYTTGTELLDLEAMLERYPDEQTDDIRDLLHTPRHEPAGPQSTHAVLTPTPAA